MSFQGTNEGYDYHQGDKPYKDEGTDYHRCWGKIMAILEITGVLLDHETITWLCEMWGVSGAGEFYEKMRSMSKDELKAWAEKAKKKKKGMVDLALEQELLRAYA